MKKFGIKAPWDEKTLLINAQSETVHEKRTFAKLFKESRCLVPADFYFEWKKSKDSKQPFAFTSKQDPPFAFAGLYRDDSFLILTCKPNHLASEVHHRMPVILNRDDEDSWLNPDTEEDKLLKMLDPFPESEMKSWPVSSLVNKPQNNFPEILKPIKVDD